MRQIVVIANDMRSTFNVGSLLRTAEGLGVEKVYLTGYTPSPLEDNDSRLPHISAKLDTQIAKTALGAEKMVSWRYKEHVTEVIEELRDEGYQILALEQSVSAIELPNFMAPDKVALLLGTEVTGIPSDLLKLTDTHIVIPMFGKKESFNVVQAAAMALYQLRFS